MSALVPINKGKATEVALTDIQNRLAARREAAEVQAEELPAGVVVTRKARKAAAEEGFRVDPLKTLVKIQDLARALADAFDGTITTDVVPLTQDQINQVSDEFLHLDHLKAQIAALEPRYRELIFAHLDATGPTIPGRPKSQVPGKVAAKGPGTHYEFERRGGNRDNAILEAEGLRAALPAEVAAEIFKTIHHDPVPAWDEEVFDQDALNRLVLEKKIDLDTIAPFLTPGEWRTPAFWKILVEGD